MTGGRQSQKKSNLQSVHGCRLYRPGGMKSKTLRAACRLSIVPQRLGVKRVTRFLLKVGRSERHAVSSAIGLHQ
jgi:hypothetical protein